MRGTSPLAGTLIAWMATVTVPGLSGCWIEDVGSRNGEPAASEVLYEEIRGMLDASAAAWNRGDLDAFLADYERSPNTTYIGSVGRISGWDAIRARYAPGFAPGAARDSLRFVDLQVRPLGQRYALATARYVLHRGDEVTSTGLFTLVLVSVEGRWRIIHDHSSADASGEEPPSASEPPEGSVADSSTPGG